MSGERCPSIAVVTGSLSPRAGGMYFSSRIPANLLSARGSRVSVIGLRDDLYDEYASTWSVGDLRALKRRGPGGLLSTRSMVQALHALRPELIHLRGLWGPNSLAVWRWSRSRDVKVVISPHGMLDEGAIRFSSIKKRMAAMMYERRNLNHASVVHALNSDEARSIRAFGVRAPVATIPNGVDLSKYPATRSASPESSREMLFLSRIHPKKGLLPLLQGWGLVRDRDRELSRPWRLKIAGWDDGGHLAALQSAVRELGLSELVSFVGPLFDQEKRDAVAASAGLILPSFSEGLPIAVLEAWAARRPVLMSSHCNLPEGFEAGAALQLEPNAASICDTLESFFRLSEDQRTSMGEAGRRLVEERYDWAKIVDHFTELYAWTLGASRPAFVDV